jgi:hypothetical protein
MGSYKSEKITHQDAGFCILFTLIFSKAFGGIAVLVILSVQVRLPLQSCLLKAH